MSEESVPSTAPVCKPTKWFLWRAIAMLVMFGVFSVWFYSDWKWGYREANFQYYVHEAFVKAGADFKAEQAEAGWNDYASKQLVAFPDDAGDVLPEGTDLKMPWPEEIVEGHARMKELGGQAGAKKLWEDYSGARGWDADVLKSAHDKGDIKVQLYCLWVVIALVLVTLFILIRTLRRQISADEEALYTQDGRTIPYGDMLRIDKRKWDTKGLALVHYKSGEGEKTAKIDGMVYGQFKEEDGAPAEKLFAYVMERFQGEVIEYLDEDDLEQPDETASEDADDVDKQGD